MRTDWTRQECREIVADYFVMFEAEMRAEGYVKAEHRRALIPKLNERSEGSIERKHMNISAALIDLGLPYIDGYKPYSNYQSILRDEVERYLADHPTVIQLVEQQVAAEATLPTVDDILTALESPPSPREEGVSDEQAVYAPRIRKIDYPEREARNQSLGQAGESFVMRYEQARLIHAGQERLADQVEQMSETQGDGAGFDILSFEENGADRYIEVKTTRYGKETPFYATANEVRFSEGHDDRYQLYRCFGFAKRPRLFALEGAISKSASMQAKVFLCWV